MDIGRATVSRGAQTIGELKTHTARMYQFKDLDRVRATLNELADHPEGPYVVMLARKTGQKENRYMHLFCGMPETGELEDKQVSTLDSNNTTDLLDSTFLFHNDLCHE